MKRAEIQDWVEKQKHVSSENETIEISKKDLLRVVEILNDPFNVLKAERRNVCFTLMYQLAETLSLKRQGLYDFVKNNQSDFQKVKYE